MAEGELEEDNDNALVAWGPFGVSPKYDTQLKSSSPFSEGGCLRAVEVTDYGGGGYPIKRREDGG